MVVFIITLFIAIMLLGCSRESSSQNTFNIGQFENAMKDKGYSCEIIDVSQDFLPTTRKRMIIDDETIDIYLFDSDTKMEEEASYIDSGGCSYSNGSKSVEVSWVSFPHFYKKGSLIVQYVGENENIMSDLEDIFGEQFAGYVP
jgi:hypothetical protein